MFIGIFLKNKVSVLLSLEIISNKGTKNKDF